MKYFLLIFLLVQISFSSELTRKIMVSSFHTQKDADLALTVFNKNKSDKFNDLQEELDFKVISRKSDNFYIISIEAFKDYTEAKLVLNEISKKYPDAYINKYDSKISQAIEEETVEEPKQNIHIITKKLFENIDNEKNENIKIGDSQKQETIKTENTFEEMKMDNKEEESLKFKNNDYSFIYYSDDSILFNVKRNLSIFPLIKDSSIIKVEYKDYTAKRSSDFVNQLLKEYLIQNIEDNSKQLKETIEFIEVQLEKEKKELSEAEIELELFRSENLLFNIEKKVEQINKQKDELQNELLSIQRNKKIFDAMKESLLKGEMVSSSFLKDLPILDTIELLNKERNTQQELSTKYTPFHKTMITLTNKINALEETLIQNIRNTDSSFTETEKSLIIQIEDLNQELLSLPNLAMQLSKLERKFNLKESIYKDLLLKFNDTSSKYISSKHVNRIIDYAQIPETPIKPKLLFILIIGFMISLLIAFIVVLIKEYFDKYIKRPSDLTNLSNTPYYGYIPFVKSKNYNKLFILDDLSSPESESLRRIRSSLELTSNKDRAKIVLITSTVSNEGKSTFISNLALMVALSNKRTILLGLDLRIPQLHTKFSINNQKGMSEVLSKNIELKDAIRNIEINNNSTYCSIDIIPSGSIPVNPTELIENGTIDSVLEILKEEYDYIFIDSTPTALVPDTISLLKKADTVLFTFKSEYSKKEYVRRTDELIKKFNLKSVGFVLTSVKKKYFEELKYDKNYNLFATKSKH
ncbi:MAG: polysaccharide biosynthesis tyrosine autokinase [Aliarcobacter sp.]|nr:polysaccharide biosynthesis tyrosine autokinase [Aliarcobacter sp.]